MQWALHKKRKTLDLFKLLRWLKGREEQTFMIKSIIKLHSFYRLGKKNNKKKAKREIFFLLQSTGALKHEQLVKNAQQRNTGGNSMDT